MKLDPLKCAFGVESGNFLNFMASERGIEANLKNVVAIINLPPPWNINEVQKLVEQMAALKRFISRSTDKNACRLEGSNETARLERECYQAFKALKEYLTCPLLLSQVEPGEDLLAYLSVSSHTVLAVLV